MLPVRTVLCSTALAASLGCMPTPVASTAAPEETTGSVTSQPPEDPGAWRPGSAWSDDPPPRLRVMARQRSWDHGTGSGRWGRHYPWRGKGPRPAWYGHQPHVSQRVIQVGQYYYPYYDVGSDFYPVYSMPYERRYGGFAPSYGPLPEFGPLTVPKSKAQTFERR